MRAESRKALAGAACLLVALLVAAPARGQETYAADHVQVLAVVDRFFETMTAADSAGARAIMLPEGVSFGVRESTEGLFLGAMPNAEYIAGVAFTMEPEGCEASPLGPLAE
jgi:hypothetical protein